MPFLIPIEVHLVSKQVEILLTKLKTSMAQVKKVCIMKSQDWGVFVLLVAWWIESIAEAGVDKAQ